MYILLKWLVLSATLLIGLIIIVQLFWLSKVYSFEKKQFNNNVVKSLRGVFEDLQMNDNPAVNLQQLIVNPETDYFLFKADTIPPEDSLTFYLQQRICVDFDVLDGCEDSAPIAARQKKIYLPGIYSNGSHHPGYPGRHRPPGIYNESFDHILLYFPHRSSYILSEMVFWIVSSIGLALALIGLAISLVYFYRQRFLAEIQKDFVNNFTHEFKTPLAVIKIAGDVLAQDVIVQKPERLKRYAEIIQHQTEHLQNQVEKLLKSASLETKSFPIEKEMVNPAQLIEQALSKLQPLVEQKKARIDLHIMDVETMIHGDKTHLELAVVNLLENALKYSDDPKILVRAEKEMSDYYISIKDNGIGIEKKYLKNIFKKFYRVPTGNVHDVKGFGMGLDFVKRIMDAHGGKIIVNSVPGIGTEFRLELPF